MKHLFIGGPANGQWLETEGRQFRMVSKPPELGPNPTGDGPFPSRYEITQPVTYEIAHVVVSTHRGGRVDHWFFVPQGTDELKAFLNYYLGERTKP